MTVYDKRKEQEVLHFSFQEVSRRVTGGTLPQVAVVEVVTDILKKQAVTLTREEYTKWCHYLLAVATNQAQKSVLSISTTPLVLGQDVHTRQSVILEQVDRFGGMYVIGKTGSGKTNFLVNLILQDIAQGRGLCFIDPNGDATRDIIRRWPKERSIDDCILLDPLDPDYAFGVNMFACDPRNREQVSLIVNFILDVFAKLFTESGSFLKEAPNMARTLRHAAYTLIDNFPQYHTTLAEMPLLFKTEETARKRLMQNIQRGHKLTYNFWEEYGNMKPQDKFTMVGSTVSRLEGFLLDEHILHIVGQPTSTLHIFDLMQQGRVILVPLPRTQPQLSSLVGGVLVAQIAQAAFLRGQIPEDARRPFFLYVDEFQHMATSTFAELLAEVRKFKIATCVGHQYRQQLDAANRGATLNAQNLVVFPIQGDDGQELAAQLERKPTTEKRYEKRLREEFKKSHVSTPVSYLLRGQTHPSSKVMAFIRFLAPLAHTRNEYFEANMMDELDSVFAKAMTEKNTLHAVSFQTVALLTLYTCIQENPYYPGTPPPSELSRALSGPAAPLDYVRQIPMEVLRVSCVTHFPLFYFTTGLQVQVKNREYHAYTPDPGLLRAYDSLWTGTESSLSSALKAYHEQVLKAAPATPYYSLSETSPSLPVHKAAFEKTVVMLRAALRDIAAFPPLEEHSGIVEQVEEIQEREVDISTHEILDQHINELVNPEKPYCARVKLGRTEYTIQTDPLVPPDSEHETAARRQHIRTHTNTHYATPREQVMQEIQAREEALTTPAVIGDAAPSSAASSSSGKRKPRTKQ